MADDLNVPVGTILLWDQGTIPAKYSLCDGGTYNGIQTPDCRNRFIWACPYDSTLKTTGGNSTHTHTWSQETETREAHGHTGISALSDPPNETNTAFENQYGSSFTTSTHRHRITVDINPGGAHSHALGVVSTESHIPRHIKLCYIMRTEV